MIQIYNAVQNGVGVISAGVHLYQGNAGIGDLLAFAPAIGYGLNRLKILCFVADTQVVVGIEADGQFATKAVQDIVEDAAVLSRDENDPNGPLVFSRVDRVYRRTSDHLRVLTLRDGMGREQVLKTTDDHPFFVIGQGQKSAGDLHVGELLDTPNELASQVVKTVREEHPDGIPVYNFRVEGTHTDFVRAEGSHATPVWVHNANYGLVPSTTVGKGIWGEARLAQVLGFQGVKPTKAFKSTIGKRFVDRLLDDIAHEAKAGIDVGLNATTRRQALRDAELIAEGQIKGAHWHFFQGANQNLLFFLKALGINVTVY